ncbi:MAG: hypothetical protein ABR520_06670 [Mycobacteriales bacterium]
MWTSSWQQSASCRRVDLTRAPYWYLDNGASKLARSNHCNTAIVRWTLRERGIVLAGPPPATLIDVVPPAELRREFVAAARNGR